MSILQILWWFFFVIMPVLSIAIVLFIFKKAGLAILRLAVESWSWETAAGKILRSGSAQVQTQNGINYKPDVSYEYEVGQTKYRGETFSIGNLTFSGNKAQTIISQMLRHYPQGARTQIYYNPKNPKMSVLEPGIKVQHLLLPVVALAIICVSLLIIVAGLLIKIFV